MLFLLFHIGADRFVIETARVVEVLAFLYWKEVPDPPPGVVGIMNYHGAPVPVIDLSLLVLGRPANPRMSTRILLVDTVDEATPSAGLPARIGLIAEQVVGTARYEAAAFVAPDTMVDTARYLGPMLTDESGIIQRIEIDRVLASSTRSRVLAAGGTT